MLPFEGYSGSATSPPPCSPHSAPISPQLLPGLRSPSLAPAWGSGSALPGFGRPTAIGGEAGSSSADNAIARRQYHAAYIKRARLVRQSLARVRSAPRHVTPSPRPQGVPPLCVSSPTPAWDARQCLTRSDGFSPEMATLQAHVGAAGAVPTHNLPSISSLSPTSAWDARQCLARAGGFSPKLSTLQAHVGPAAPIPMHGLSSAHRCRHPHGPRGNASPAPAVSHPSSALPQLMLA
jgi:hypothetical protein